MTFRLLIAAGLLAGLPLAQAQAQPQSPVYLAGGSQWRPFSYTDDQARLRGVAVEIAQRVLKQANLDAQFVSYPVNRLQAMLDKDQLDFNYAESPNWKAPAQAARFVFSVPYLNVREHLYFAAGNPAAQLPAEQLSNLTIGMVRGYTYPRLDAAFEFKRLQKLETSQDQALLELLKIGRVDAVAMVDDLYQSLVASGQIDASRFRQGAQLSEAPLTIMLQARHAALLPQINAAITTLQRSGEIERIRQGYRPAASLACHSPSQAC
ncbi:transporter substrate-binding domain-containing protein [Pseudomonas syringae]|nr:transporter substrate-binding domain-containing protein [Pseudomonas syringae]MBD8788086.1 transporter substrate-binding domain-containing protein [Pseudomonas syringae]MBD8799715.1 transporter substrate-binding domain-containing protein [Pseudomonas syringae]MBD8814262.1 transporter substrate-binding domain-containing protein [Pseudomonas syringae]